MNFFNLTFTKFILIKKNPSILNFNIELELRLVETHVLKYSIENSHQIDFFAGKIVYEFALKTAAR